MKNIILATTAIVGFTSVAAAESPSSAPSVNWTGAYVGRLDSFDGGDFDVLSLGVIVQQLTFDSSTSFALFAGYNKQVNDLVYGAEFAYSTGDIPLVGLPTTYYHDRIDLKGRAGYSFGRAMIYGVLGYSWSDLHDGSLLHPSSGFNYGAGVEVMVSDHIFVGAEYLMRELIAETGSSRLDGHLRSANIRAGFRF